MVSSQRIEDYPHLVNRTLWKVTPENEKALKQYITARRMDNLSLKTIDTFVYILINWLRHPQLSDIYTASNEQIAEVYLLMKDEVAMGKMKQSSLNLYTFTLKSLLQCIRPNDASDLLNVRTRPVKNMHTSDEYIDESDVKKMFAVASAAGNIRDVALIMTLFGTGARISEILDANIGDVKIMQTHAIITVAGKTGKRNIPFVTGLPELMTWINNHPMKLPSGAPDPNAPLFVTKNTRGNGVKRLNKRTAWYAISKIAKEADIDPGKKCNPHSFRHLLATTMAKKLTAKEMNLYFGWKQHSNTSLTYIHTSDKDLERSILGIYGVVDPETEVKQEEWTIQCPSCGMILPAGAQYCTRCRLILDPVLAVQNQEQVKHAQEGKYVQEYLRNKAEEKI